LAASKNLTPEQRSLRARAGAHAVHARYDSREITAAAKAAFYARFEDEVDPERILDPDERARRAKHAMQSHMAVLAMKSAKARRKGAA